MTIGGVQNIFPQSRELNVTFDWLDLASGSGYISYDFFSSVDSVGINRQLIETRDKAGLFGVNNSRNGLPICISTGSDASGTLQQYLDLDWDSSPFNLPRTIKGKAFINFRIAASMTNPMTMYVIVKFRKWDGSTETDLLSIQSNTISIPSTLRAGVSLSGTIPQTNIKKGEQIRISIECWGTSGGGTAYLSLSGQPDDSSEADGNNTFQEGETRIITFIPYKINT